MATALTPMTSRKLANLIAKMGQKEGWHLFLDGEYRGFSPLSMKTEIENTLRNSPHMGFVDYMGNNLFFITTK